MKETMFSDLIAAFNSSSVISNGPCLVSFELPPTGPSLCLPEQIRSSSSAPLYLRSKAAHSLTFQCTPAPLHSVFRDREGASLHLCSLDYSFKNIMHQSSKRQLSDERIGPTGKMYSKPGVLGSQRMGGTSRQCCGLEATGQAALMSEKDWK